MTTDVHAHRPAGIHRLHATWSSSRSLRVASILIIYGAALVLCFHAIVLHPESRIYGFTDGTSTIRDYWAAAYQHRNPFNFTHDALLGAPQGTTRTPATTVANGFLQALVVWGLHGIFGWVGAWNVFMLLGVLATALAMCALLVWTGCSLGASILGGYVFGFSPYALERAYAGHLGLLQNWVIVLELATLLQLHRTWRVRYACAAGATISVAFYLSAYQGLLAAFMVLVFGLLELVLRRGRRVRTFGLFSLAYLVSLLALIPVLVLYADERAAVDQVTTHLGANFYHYSAKLYAYFLPSERNPLFHWLGNVNTDPTEETLFWGYLTLLLALAAVVMLFRGSRFFRRPDGFFLPSVYAALLAPAAFLMSLSPTYRLFSLTVPMPSDVLVHVTSFWRVYSRFGLLAGFAVVLLATFALTALSSRPGRIWRLLTPAAALIIFIELLPGNVEPISTHSVPAWVDWLRSHPEGIVATYPWPVGFALPEDDWYQIYDRDPQYNAASVAGTQEAIRILSDDLEASATASVLKTENVRYVVVHENEYRQYGEAPAHLDRHQYTLLRRFGATGIYAIHAARINIASALRADVNEIALIEGYTAPTLSFGSGFNASEQFNGQTSRWMIQNGQLRFSAQTASDITLTALGFSNAQPRELELRDAKGHLLGRENIATSSTTITFGPFSVPAGTTTLTLTATPGPVVLAPSDPRDASVFIEQFAMNALPSSVVGSAPS